MDFSFCIKKCVTTNKDVCISDSQESMKQFYEQNLRHLVLEVEKIIPKYDFNLKMNCFVCFSNGYSCKYNLVINDCIIREICFEHVSFCPLYCVIFFLNQLEEAIKSHGFQSIYSTPINPYTVFSFRKI